MHIPKQILKCTSTDKTRTALHHVYVDVVAKQAWATDGHIAVCIPITPDDGDCSGFVPRGAIEAADKQPKALKGQLLHGENTTTVFGVGTWDNPQEDTTRFPLALLQAMCHMYGQRVMHVDVALLKIACDVLRNTRVSIYHDPHDTEQLLYMENTRGERVVVVSISSTHAERTARSAMWQHCAEEGIDF